MLAGHVADDHDAPHERPALVLGALVAALAGLGEDGAGPGDVALSVQLAEVLRVFGSDLIAALEL